MVENRHRKEDNNMDESEIKTDTQHCIKNGLLARRSSKARRDDDPREWVRNGRFIRKLPRELSSGSSIPVDSGN